MGEIDDAIGELTDAGLLTERQAEAYVYRDVEAVPREATADAMGISVNVLDKHLSAARSKVDQAQDTTRAVESIRYGDIPDNCAECGDRLTSWTVDDNGVPLCPDCSGVPADATTLD